MHRIQYLTDARTIEIGSDTTLLRASLDHGIAHTHVCGGWSWTPGTSFWWTRKRTLRQGAQGAAQGQIRKASAA